MSLHCEDFAVENETGEWDRYQGVDAYDQVLSDLYDKGYVQAYYEIQSYWGQYCDGSPHQCGLVEENDEYGKLLKK